MLLFAEFLLRLVFGLSAGMAIVSPRQVASGYYRNNLYVTLALALLATLLCRTLDAHAFWYAVAAAAASYAGSACWLYEKSVLARQLLVVLAVVALLAAMNLASAQKKPDAVLDRYITTSAPDRLSASDAEQLVQRARTIGTMSAALSIASVVTSGLLLGVTMASMLLGHWYLNSPTMQIAPLRKLLVAMACVTILQIVVSACGLAGEMASAKLLPFQWWLFVALRWLFGLIGVAILTFMTWRTLDIPNTQSATGILYVAVIGTFVGETMALLLSRESVYPLYLADAASPARLTRSATAVLRATCFHRWSRSKNSRSPARATARSSCRSRT